MAASASADAGKVQPKGRFEVYDSDASASSEARVRVAVRAPALRLRQLTRAAALLRAQGTKVRKGRFMVEESSDGDSVRASRQRSRPAPH